MCDTYSCDYLQRSTFRFNLIDFQFNADFPSQFCVFYRKIRDRFLKKILLKRVNTRRLLFVCLFVCLFVFVLCRNIGSNNSFTLIENNFWFLRYRSLNSWKQYTIAYGQNAPSCVPLKSGTHFQLQVVLCTHYSNTIRDIRSNLKIKQCAKGALDNFRNWRIHIKEVVRKIKTRPNTAT